MAATAYENAIADLGLAPVLVLLDVMNLCVWPIDLFTADATASIVPPPDRLPFQGGETPVGVFRRGVQELHHAGGVVGVASADVRCLGRRGPCPLAIL